MTRRTGVVELRSCTEYAKVLFKTYLFLGDTPTQLSQSGLHNGAISIGFFLAY